MRILRIILGVVVGYLIFAVSAVLLFQFAGIDPHADASFSTTAGVIVFGIVFSIIGGYVCRLIAGRSSVTANYALAILMAAFAVFSLLKSPGNHYTQLAAIFLFAPASLVGGIIAGRTTR